MNIELNKWYCLDNLLQNVVFCAVWYGIGLLGTYQAVSWIRICRIHVFLDPDPSINQAKIVIKTDSYRFVTSFWLYIFKNDVNVPLR